MLHRLFNPRTIAVLVLALMIGAISYGFAAANIVPESGAGDGSGAISGYTVTNVNYTLNATNPANIDAVTFDLAPTAGAGEPTTVKVKLVSTGSTYYSCSAGVSPSWSCDTTSPVVTTAAADELRVIAAQ